MHLHFPALSRFSYHITSILKFASVYPIRVSRGRIVCVFTNKQTLYMNNNILTNAGKAVILVLLHLIERKTAALDENVVVVSYHSTTI